MKVGVYLHPKKPNEFSLSSNSNSLLLFIFVFLNPPTKPPSSSCITTSSRRRLSSVTAILGVDDSIGTISVVRVGQAYQVLKMPLYDCVLLLKPHLKKDSWLDLVARVGKHVYARNGVITGIKSFGTVHLGYGIKKLDGRYFQGQLMQMTMMATPNINKELHYLNKEDRLLRWLLVKHRDTRFGLDYLDNEDSRSELNKFNSPSIYDDADGDEDEDDDEYDEELEKQDG